MLTMQREIGSLPTPCNEKSESILPYTEEPLVITKPVWKRKNSHA